MLGVTAKQMLLLVLATRWGLAPAAEVYPRNPQLDFRETLGMYSMIQKQEE